MSGSRQNAGSTTLLTSIVEPKQEKTVASGFILSRSIHLFFESNARKNFVLIITVHFKSLN